MTLLQVINTIQTISSVQPNIHSFVGEFLDLNDVTAKYSAIVLQQRTHRRNNDFITYSFYLGYADRLNEDKSNEVEVQSTAIQVIDDIVYKLENLNLDCTVGVYNTFTQRFLAEAAGGYVELDITTPIGECEDDFAEEKLDTTITANGEYNFIPKGLGFQSVHLNVDVAHLQDKSLNITKNGNYQVRHDKPYSGLGLVDVNVAIDTDGYYNEGYDKGKTDGIVEGQELQKSKLTDINIIENNTTYTNEDGYRTVTVNIDTQGVYDQGVEAGTSIGIQQQKDKLTDITITENGSYSREDGYGSITVDVPISEINNQEKNITITQNGQTDIVPDTDYTGLSKVGVNVNINTQSYYDNGYSQGKIDGKVEGIAEQKAKLTDLNITENGTYTREDGYKSVVADIHPKDKLERTYIENGQYLIDGEYKDGVINVNVPVPVINNQEKSITINSNGTSSVIPDTGYTGLSKINITTNVPTSGGDGIDLTSLGYTAQENTSINTDIQDSIAYSQSLLESYTDDTKYEYDSYMMFAPKFPTDKRTTFEKMFFSCGSLKTIPLIDTSNGTNFRCMFDRCSALENISPINTGKGTNFANMFNYCISLKTIPALDTSNGTNFYGMFDECYTLENIPPINTGKGTDFSYMFVNCQSLTTIPQLDTTNGTNFEFMFDDCQSLTTIPQLDTANGTKFRYMFAISTSLTTIPQLDISNGNDFYYMFGGCSKLTDITFIGSINADISFKDCRRLTYNSIKSILTACSNTATITAKTIEFNQVVIDQNGELQNLVATCTSKGWTIENLTIKTA